MEDYLFPPQKCSRCASDAAKRWWPISGTHTKTGNWVLFKVRRHYPVSVNVPVCDACFTELKRKSWPDLIGEVAEFKGNGQLLHFKHAAYQAEFARLNGLRYGLEDSAINVTTAIQVLVVLGVVFACIASLIGQIAK
jgi:hypothetical protein